MKSGLLLVTTALLLAGCDVAGLGADPRAAQREADGKAIGGACRHALRGIEECYQLNPKSPKTAIFEGWREMDQYMRENKLDGQATPAPEASKPSAESTAEDEDAPATPEGKPRAKRKSN